ncbi:hypothetical protein LG634_05275 [Streptomyces bambusae]|uniref:hypothetical protein n=1 Tax=Streptomyces bambusae TaxID=1550616 RepID=UPI001CFED87A|nr:hypothetical protein [Streptomyces bambusae]MCB5164249.1 hypothetical protein [Streptomyces bambusae]
MAELGVLFGLLGLAVVALVVTVLRRGRRRHDDDGHGALIEHEHTAQAAHTRKEYNSFSVHNSQYGGKQGGYRP